MLKTNEAGRSMVEMLGVLAIIGVLSIGGILGYTTAMNRHRANQIIDAAAKISVIAQTQNAAVNLQQIDITDPANALGITEATAAAQTGIVSITWGSAVSGVRTAVSSILGVKAETGCNNSSSATCQVNFSAN